MRKWGILVTVCYGVVLLFFIVPGVMKASYPDTSISKFYGGAAYEPLFWVWVSILIGCQAMLLLLSVDSSVRRLSPRQHVLLSVATIAISIALLTGAAVYSALAGIWGDRIPEALFISRMRLVAPLLVLWVFWGVIFYLYAKGTPIAMTRLVGWLMKGSVLELLIAVSCHVIVRRRGDCSAPLLSGYGIATGVAIMLLSFGPSVLFLYKRRLKQYRRSIVGDTSAESRAGDFQKGN